MNLEKFMSLTNVEKVEYVLESLGAIKTPEYQMSPDLNKVPFEQLHFTFGVDDNQNTRTLVDVGVVRSESERNMINGFVRIMAKAAPKGVSVLTMSGKSIFEAVRKDLIVKEEVEKVKRSQMKADNMMSHIDDEYLPAEIAEFVKSIKEKFGDAVQVKAMREPKEMCSCSTCSCRQEDEFEWNPELFGMTILKEFGYSPESTEQIVNVSEDNQFATTEIPFGKSKIRVVLNQNYEVVEKTII